MDGMEVEPDDLVGNVARAYGATSFSEEKRLLLRAATSTRLDRQSLEAFRRHLQRASSEVLDSPEIMLEILRSLPRPWVLDCASPALLNSRDFMLAAMEVYPEAMQHAGSELISDRELVLETLRRLQELARSQDGLSPHALSLSSTCWCHSDQLRSDREVVFEALKISAENLWKANREIKEDKDFVLLASRYSHEPSVIRRQALVLPCSWHEFRDASESVLACRGETAPVASLTLRQDRESGLRADARLLSGTSFSCFLRDFEAGEPCLNDLAKLVLAELPRHAEVKPLSRIFLVLSKIGCEDEVAVTAWDWKRPLTDFV